MKKTFLLSAAFISAVCFLATPANADVQLSVTYYTVSGSDPDFNTNPCCNYVSTNEVQSTLVNGRPVYNSSYTVSGSGDAGNLTNAPGTPLVDVDPATKVLTWWSPSLNSNVTQTGTGLVTLPFSNGSFFPPNGMGTGDGSGFQTAVFTGVLHVPVQEQVTFTFGADDDAFLAIGNTVIDQLGAIHGDTPAPVTTQTLNPGDYTLTLFFADRHQTGAALNFSVDTQDVTVTAGVPEPSTWVMMLLGFCGLGLLAHRRKNRAPRLA